MLKLKCLKVAVSEFGLSMIMYFKTHCFVYKQSLMGLFYYIELHCIVYMFIFHEDVTYQHTLFVNSSKSNQSFTDYLADNTYVYIYIYICVHQ